MGDEKEHDEIVSRVGWWRIARWLFTYPIMLVVGGTAAVVVRLLTGEVLLAVLVGLAVAYAVPYVVIWSLLRRAAIRRGLPLHLGRTNDPWPY